MVRKRLIFNLVTLVITLVLLEVLSLAALLIISALRPERVVGSLVAGHFQGIDEEYRAAYREVHDSELGWDNRPGSRFVSTNVAGEEWCASYDPDGARHDDRPPTGLAITTYGDSFTHGNEVNDDQTWQHYLAEFIGLDVRNYGVSAFGTGQALLKLERHVEEGIVPPIIILGIHETNINRVGNLFRPFLYPTTGMKLGFKPAFRLGRADRVELIPNPYRDRDTSLEDLRELALRMAHRDMWASRLGFVRFPFTWRLGRQIVLVADRRIRSWTANHPYTLWETDEGFKVMEYLISEFARIAEEAGAEPVVLFIPGHHALESGELPLYARFVAHLRDNHPDLVIVDVAEHEFDARRFTILPFEGHASPYGNQVIAEILARALAARRPDLVDVSTFSPRQ